MKSEEIFKYYIKDSCPVCNEYKDSDDFYAHTESGGKCMAMFFRCEHCDSEYTIGLERSRMPIKSEITSNYFKASRIITERERKEAINKFVDKITKPIN